MKHAHIFKQRDSRCYEKTRKIALPGKVERGNAAYVKNDPCNNGE